MSRKKRDKRVAWAQRQLAKRLPYARTQSEAEAIIADVVSAVSLKYGVNPTRDIPNKDPGEIAVEEIWKKHLS